MEKLNSITNSLTNRKKKLMINLPKIKKQDMNNSNKMNLSSYVPSP